MWRYSTKDLYNVVASTTIQTHAVKTLCNGSRSRGRNSAANFRTILAIPLLVGLINTGRVWKALVQTVRFLILKFNFLHFSMIYGYFYKKGLVWPTLTLEQLRQVPRLRRILRGPAN